MLLIASPVRAVEMQDAGATQPARATAVNGWLEWRGPNQNGTSTEKNLPDTWSPDANHNLWKIELSGQGTPVIAVVNGQERVYSWGYRGSRGDLLEVLMCIDADTGEVLWEHTFSDFLSDIVYNRYSIGAPSVDRETGNVYLLTSPGLLLCFDSEGKKIWEISLTEAFGRLTFPNGRTGGPAIDGDLVIVNNITSNWGAEGPARNRFYAFDKRTGEMVWSSTPGVGPPFLRDSSFSTPVFENRNGMRVFYAGTGCGNIVCVNARTGQPLWRYQMSYGGVNSQPLVVDDLLVAVHGKENMDDSGSGRMVGLDLVRIFQAVEAQQGNPEAVWPMVIDQKNNQQFELWRNNSISMFTSSPTWFAGRIYQVDKVGVLHSVDPKTGESVWKQKIGVDQLHASPLAADGKLYIPLWNDGFKIIRPGKDSGEVISETDLGDEKCIGSPAVFNGKMYLHTTRALYCFGEKDRNAVATDASVASAQQNQSQPVETNSNGKAVSYQVVPAEVLLRPGDEVQVKVYALDRQGKRLGALRGGTWKAFIPATALVKSQLDAQMSADGVLTVGSDAKLSAGAFRVEKDGVSGTFRGRVLSPFPIEEDFESYELSQQSADGEAFAHPPLPWIGARMKWEVRERDGSKVLRKTLDNVLFQRSMIFFGHPEDRQYTIEADLMTDGNRRGKGDVGLINQRYIARLRGSNQVLQVFSNLDRLSVEVPFKFRENQWYRMKMRVDVDDQRVATIRVKAWLRDEDEPQDWTIEVENAHGHTNGSPGIFGFSPGSLFAVYVDNVSVTDNE